MYDRVGRVLYQGDGTRRDAMLLAAPPFLRTGTFVWRRRGVATAATFAGIADIKADLKDRWLPSPIKATGASDELIRMASSR
jgi:hypothetical protein